MPTYDNITLTAFIPWEDKALILQRAHDDVFLAGHWEQAGGKAEGIETHLDALIREVEEETGLHVKPLHAYHEFEYTTPDREFTRETAYMCELIGEPKITLSREYQAHLWVAQRDIEVVSPMTEYMRSLLHKGFQELV